jgi:hypothetical protein
MLSRSSYLNSWDILYNGLCAHKPLYTVLSDCNRPNDGCVESRNMWPVTSNKQSKILVALDGHLISYCRILSLWMWRHTACWKLTSFERTCWLNFVWHRRSRQQVPLKRRPRPATLRRATRQDFSVFLFLSMYYVWLPPFVLHFVVFFSPSSSSVFLHFFLPCWFLSFSMFVFLFAWLSLQRIVRVCAIA